MQTVTYTVNIQWWKNEGNIKHTFLLVDQLVFYCHQGEVINLRSHNAMELWHELCFSFCFGNNKNSQGSVCLPWCGPQGIKRSFSMVLYTGIIKNDLGLITLLGYLLVELLNKSDIFQYYIMKAIYFSKHNQLLAQCCCNAFIKGSLNLFFISSLWALITSRRKLVNVLKLVFFFPCELTEKNWGEIIYKSLLKGNWDNSAIYFTYFIL